MKSSSAENFWLSRHKERSPKRGMLWESIAANLNVLKVPKFKVDKRFVKSNFNKVLVPKYEKKRSEDRRASGISPERDELDELLEEIIEKIEVANKNEEELSEAGR